MKPQRGVGYDKDPYKPRAKARGATRCADCGALFHRGRWTWRASPSHAIAGLCPACRRVREHAPAGFVRLRDAYKGELKYRYSKGERLLRVSWMR